jgi:hypothetical protein
LHILALAAMWWLPSQVPAPSGQTLYEREIEPHKDKIVWYHLRKLPEISPAQSVAMRDFGAQKQNKAILISQAPDAPPSARLTWTERPEPEPRQFEAPDMISVRKRPEIAQAAPELAPEAAGQPALAQLQIPKLAPKAFVAPAAQPKRAAREPRPVSLADAPILIDAPKPAGWDRSLSAVAAASGVRTPKPFTPPEAKKPGAREGAGTVPEIGEAPAVPAGGASDVNALALNTLHPMLSLGPPPVSNSRISAGPRAGTGGEGSGAGLRIPGITVQPGSHSAIPGATATLARPQSPPSFEVTAVAPLQQTFSAPLAPSARSIPAAIEARFHQRVVYTVVLPMRKAPGYGADWIMWFAERDPQSGSAAQIQMRAPLPVRKTYRAGAGAAELTGRIQLAATIDRNGNIGEISRIGTGTAVNYEAAVEDLKAWQFLPALRNRLPVDTEVVLEITFNSTVHALGVHSFAGTTTN